MSLAEKVLAGDAQAAARLITMLEDGSTDALAEMDVLYTRRTEAHIVGITGAPGTGKSTLLDRLISHFRKQDKNIGVIAIDPTSALTGGALLGDRLRMQRHSTDSHVFVRSLATRGWAGGLARATLGAVRVMAAMGKDIVLLETVGSGQVELDIFRAADTTLAVLNPGAGDDIQMMKAGILEVVDIFVVNKADKGGADELKASLEAMLAGTSRNDWTPPVVLTEAVNDRGVSELAEAISKHHDYLLSCGSMEKRRRERAGLELLANLEGYVRDALGAIRESQVFTQSVDELLKDKTVPHRAAAALSLKLAEYINQQTKPPSKR